MGLQGRERKLEGESRLKGRRREKEKEMPGRHQRPVSQTQRKQESRTNRIRER